MSKPWKNRIFDFYFKRPITLDLVLSIGGVLIYFNLCYSYNFCADTTNSVLHEISSELISSSIGITGFIIAALTIILSLKESTPNKSYQESENGSELFYNSPAYGSLAKIFVNAATESVFIFFLFIMFKIYGDKIDYRYYSALSFIGVLMLMLMLLRICFLLYKLIMVHIKNQVRPTKK